jgi:hypothetical protein
MEAKEGAGFGCMAHLLAGLTARSLLRRVVAEAARRCDETEQQQQGTEQQQGTGTRQEQQHEWAAGGAGWGELQARWLRRLEAGGGFPRVAGGEQARAPPRQQHEQGGAPAAGSSSSSSSSSSSCSSPNKHWRLALPWPRGAGRAGARELRGRPLPRMSAPPLFAASAPEICFQFDPANVLVLHSIVCGCEFPSNALSLYYYLNRSIARKRHRTNPMCLTYLLCATLMKILLL